jgi:hypothetical protein
LRILKNTHASGADLQIIAIVLILSITYGTFMFLYGADNSPGTAYQQIPGQNYTTPDSSGFWSSIKTAVSLNIDNPEIFFVNTILFGTLGTLVVLIALRFLRGQG